MEENEHSLVPQWLKSSGNVSRVASISSQLTSSPSSDHVNYSGRGWSSSDKGSGLSRSYSSSARNWHGKDWEKDTDTFFHKDKLFLGECNQDHSDYVDNILPNRLEKDRLQCSKSMNSWRWRETWSPRTSGDVGNPQRNYRKTDGSVTGAVGTMRKTVLNEDFPLLGAEDKLGSSEMGRVLFSSSSTSSHSLLTDTTVGTVRNGPTSASHKIPATFGNSSMVVMMHQHSVSPSTSSIAPGTTSLSMAETLAQGPPRSHTPPQFSASPQKLEELALKQSRLLIPMTPSTPRSLIASSLEKSKVKTGQPQHPLSPNRSKVVLSSVGTSASTSVSAPSRSSSNSTPSTWMTLEKRPSQSQSRSDFLKNISRKSSSSKPCSDAYPIGISYTMEKSEAGAQNVTSCLNLKSRDTPVVDTYFVNSLTEDSSIITQKGNVLSEPLKFSSNGEQQYSTKPVLYSDEEEIAFLRSLGWEENAGDDEGLTEEEIQEFYEKYKKLKL